MNTATQSKQDAVALTDELIRVKSLLASSLRERNKLKHQIREAVGELREIYNSLDEHYTKDIWRAANHLRRLLHHLEDEL